MRHLAGQGLSVWIALTHPERAKGSGLQSILRRSACFAPHPAHALADIDLRLRSRRGAVCLTRDGPVHAIEVMGQGSGNKPAAPGKDVPIARAGLLMGVETLGHNQI